MRQHQHHSPQPARSRVPHTRAGEEPSPHPVLMLQRQIGNRAVSRLLRAEQSAPAIARTSYNEEGPIAPACVLTKYSGSQFTGKEVVADVQFVPALDRINQHAADSDVKLLITDSFRPHGRPVKGAIVPPATRSNHLAGHAIDMNVMHGPGKNELCNSHCLGKAHPPAPAKAFIDAIRGDGSLRWGGDFSDRDPVHIDDNLNSDDDAWKARYVATQQSHRDGCP